MKLKSRTFARLDIFITSLVAFANWQSLANTIELDWHSTGVSSSHITFTTGDEVDIRKFISFSRLASGTRESCQPVIVSSGRTGKFPALW